MNIGICISDHQRTPSTRQQPASHAGFLATPGPEECCKHNDVKGRRCNFVVKVCIFHMHPLHAQAVLISDKAQRAFGKI